MTHPPDDNEAEIYRALRGEALRLLARREHTRIELHTRLRRWLERDLHTRRRLTVPDDANDAAGDIPIPAAHSDAAYWNAAEDAAAEGATNHEPLSAAHELSIESVLEELMQAGWQSDPRFAQHYLRSQARNKGRLRLERELRQRGVDDSTLHAAMDLLKRHGHEEAGRPPPMTEETLGDELSRARALWQRRYGQPAENPAARARQVRFLQARGFDFDVIRQVLRSSGEDDV